MAVSLRKCAEYLSTLVEDVLDFSKIEAGRITIDAQPFNLRSVLADVGSIFAWQSQEQQMPISPQCSPDCRSSSLATRRRSSRSSSTTSPTPSNTRAAAPSRSCDRGPPARSASAEIAIEVRDQGPGIPCDEQARLFEKFNRGRRAQQERIRGTGLGLAVCRAYGEKMGGAVGFTSTPGQGSTFWFKVALPCSAAPLGRAAVETRPGPAAEPRARSLSRTRSTTCSSSTASSPASATRPITRADGNDALAKLQANLYDIVFMDWDLPGLNGVEVTRRFRQWEPPERHTLVIATTAYSTPEKRRDCLEAGMDGFAAKPLSPEKIKATIQNLSGPLRAGPSIQDARRGGASAQDPRPLHLPLHGGSEAETDAPARRGFHRRARQGRRRCSPRPCAPATAKPRAGRRTAFFPRPR